MNKFLIIAGMVALSLSAVRCGSSGSGGAERLTPAGKMSSGLGSSVSTIQNVGGAMGANGTFAIPARNVDTLSALTKCTSHGEPGSDSNSDGVVSDSEKYNSSDVHYALQKFYCTLAADTSGPETVSGSVKLMKTVICAVEKQIGNLAFDNNPVAISGITLDLTCATQAQIDNMSGSMGQTSAVLTITGGATVTSALVPTFPELGANGYYSHGVRIASNTPGLLKFIVVTKFDSSVSGNPVESGNFEFATYGTGSMMQGNAVEYTAGKISGGTSTTKHLWYEARMNRVKASPTDPNCPGTSGSCGFARHVRLSTDISFSSGDISGISNLTGIISDGGDSTGSSGQTDQMNLVTATGSLSTGISGKVWTLAAPAAGSLSSYNSVSTISTLAAQPASCIASAGSAVTTGACGAVTPLTPSGTVKTFFLPANSTTWFMDAATHSGIGFTGPATLGDEQFAL